MTRTLRVALVDDEPLAVSSLEKSLQNHPFVELVAKFFDGKTAAEKLPALEPDVVFLDIDMPGLSGLQVASQLVAFSKISIIFVTAYSEHAIEAFQLHAVHYILKPYRDAQIAQALDRVSKCRALETETLQLLLQNLEQSNPTKSYLSRFLVKEGRRSFIVHAEEVRWIRGARNYVELRTSNRTFLYRKTIDHIEQQLDPEKFVRIHRSTIIQLEELQMLEKSGHNQLIAITRDGTKHSVSIGYRPKLETLLEG